MRIRVGTPPRCELSIRTITMRMRRVGRCCRPCSRCSLGYELSDDEAIDATRALRAALHGFVTLEAVGGFGLPRDVDRSFARLVQILDTAFRNWSPERTLL